eukprot:TRINITY_DN11574_c0_g1_i1.p1 TRINITY_DN11574_c0_g1~~TRINITY_DN11574_c0_g1_i1.p1  ORF type:complete len:172 (+),score=38.77 TRINITY_DN11574_c0_g1_i1:200-715(+)
MEDIDSLGVKLNSLLYEQVVQVYPPLEASPSLTPLQRKLQAKLENDAYPFLFELAPGTPSSVTLQGNSSSVQQPRCGVDWDVEVFISTASDVKPSRKSHVHLAIRKLTFAPNPLVTGPAPRAEAAKKPTFGGGPISMVVGLDKDVGHMCTTRRGGPWWPDEGRGGTLTCMQ